MSTTIFNFALNPGARISICSQESPPYFLVEAPVKGASLSFVRVSADNLPGAHAFLCSILIDGNKGAQIGERDGAELQQIGLFVPADAVPQTVAYRFPLRSDAVSVSPAVHLNINAQEARRANPPDLNIPSAWADQGLHFEPHHHGSLWAPVLVSNGAEGNGDYRSERAESWPSSTALDGEATHTQFKREGFAILENLLPAEHVQEMARYFKALAAEGFLFHRDDNGTRRVTVTNHPVARFWHDQLNERVSQLARRPTKPSYSFVALYLAGGDLHWHTDIPQCEYTIALLLDYTPRDADGRSPWALKLEGYDGTIHSLHQRVGEALIFKGRELSHGRNVLPDGHSSISLMFHFVNEDFEGALS